MNESAEGAAPASELIRPLDNTAMSTFAECERKYLFEMVLHRRKGATPALHYGRAWHAALQFHYVSGGDLQQVMNALVAAWGDGHGVPDDHRTLERLVQAYMKYVERVACTESFKDTVGWPESPLVELSLNTLWPEIPRPYAGKIDRVLRLPSGDVVIEDHKTTSQLGASFFRGYDLDSQMFGYAWLMQQFLGEPVTGVRINAYGILKSEDRFERQVIPFTQSRLKEWATETLPYRMRRVIDATAAYHREMLASGDSRAAWAHFPMNHKSCHGKYGMCAYSSVCSLSPTVRERYLEQEFQFSPWNPLDKDA